VSEGAARPVVCFGEILWDSLRDQLGEELLQRLKAWGMDISGVSVHPTKHTGMARVTVVEGSPRFEIVEDVAWDWIELQPTALEQARNSAAVVFGSLAQHSKYNRQQLADLLNHCSSAFKVFDVNLRSPYDSTERVWSLAKRADLIKLNDQELGRLMNESVRPADMAATVRHFAERAGVPKVCLTAGATGAGLSEISFALQYDAAIFFATTEINVVTNPQDL